jgi:hypothetical protein
MKEKMTNEVATRPNSYIANTDDYYAALAAEAETYKGGGGGVLFLKFNGNDGYYSYGADDVDLPLGTRAAMDPQSLKRGWICWVDGKVKEEVMMSLVEGAPPAKHQLTDHGPYGEDDGWSEQKTIEFKTIEGDEGPVALLFQANNGSKMRALEALMKDFARSYKNHPGQVPIIEIDEREFEAKPKNGGRKVTKHAPVFKIVDWMSHDDLLALSEGSEGDYQEDEGDEGRDDGQRALPAPEPEPEARAERPARGGRVQREAPAEAPAAEERPARGGRVERPAQAAAPEGRDRSAPRGRRF